MWRSIADHTSGFAVEGADVGNQSLMLHLDQHLDELDPQYLYVLAVHPVTAVAGAINGPGAPADSRWFCQIGFSGTIKDGGRLKRATIPYFPPDYDKEAGLGLIARPATVPPTGAGRTASQIPHDG